jgi:5-methylcytosine-specific restriction endonuclease McrA
LRLLWNTPHVCAKCGRRPPQIKLHVDHVFPASRGGSSKYDNLQFLCADCNLTKSTKLEQEALWLSSV